MTNIFVFHHIGIATKNIKKCSEVYCKMGYTSSNIIVEPTQNVKISFLSKTGSPLLEIVEPLNNEAPVTKMIRNFGTTPYHTCYEVKNINSAIRKLENLNFRLLFEPIVSKAMDNGLFCYLFSPNSGLIELYQPLKKVNNYSTMKHYKIREATVNDSDFIVKAIIEAEKSGSDILSYAKIFDLTEKEVYNIFYQMLLEEVDGCEFSLSNYLVAEYNKQVVAAVCAWVEKADSPSALIKRNLLSYFLPKKSVFYAINTSQIASELVIEHVKDVLSLVIGYVEPEHRGNHLFELLTNEHIKRHNGVKDIMLQVMANNIYAVKSYERIGFETVLVKKSDDKRITDFLPYNEKFLMKKSINQ